MKKDSGFDESFICALFDGALSDEEAMKAVDLLLSDADAQAVWARMCVASDVIKGNQLEKPSDVLTRRVMAQVHAEHSVSVDRAETRGVLAKFKDLFATPRMKHRVFGGAVALVVVVVLGWQASLGLGGVDGAEQAFIDSPLNSVSVTQDAKNSQDDELVKSYFKQHQDAIFNGLQSN